MNKWWWWWCYFWRKLSVFEHILAMNGEKPWDGSQQTSMGYIGGCSLLWVGTHMYVGNLSTKRLLVVGGWQTSKLTTFLVAKLRIITVYETIFWRVLRVAHMELQPTPFTTQFRSVFMTDITVYAQSEVWLREVNCTLPSCIHGWEQLQDGQEEPICSHRCSPHFTAPWPPWPPWPGVSSQSMEPRHERRTCCSLWVSRVRLIQSQGMNTLWTAFWLWRWSLKCIKMSFVLPSFVSRQRSSRHVTRVTSVTRGGLWPSGATCLDLCGLSFLRGPCRLSTTGFPPRGPCSAALTCEICVMVATTCCVRCTWQDLEWVATTDLAFPIWKEGIGRAVKWVGCQSLGESSISINPLL